jgi:hypothetical protein
LGLTLRKAVTGLYAKILIGYHGAKILHEGLHIAMACAASLVAFGVGVSEPAWTRGWEVFSRPDVVSGYWRCASLFFELTGNFPTVKFALEDQNSGDDPLTAFER